MKRSKKVYQVLHHQTGNTYTCRSKEGALDVFDVMSDIYRDDDFSVIEVNAILKTGKDERNYEVSDFCNERP